MGEKNEVRQGGRGIGRGAHIDGTLQLREREGERERMGELEGEEVMNKQREEEVKLRKQGIVEVNPKPSKGLISTAIDLLEKVVVKVMYDSSQTHHWLSGNFAPVPHETPPSTCLPVHGHLPVTSSALEKGGGEETATDHLPPARTSTRMISSSIYSWLSSSSKTSILHAFIIARPFLELQLQNYHQVLVYTLDAIIGEKSNC
ncbi:hypothetical protein Cgig2_020358 [Carnegiea gigantea]|uniref:Uncharacterized protein n=1 Tax=Carnegiea gigantea TaxID=171969 RepID=A0A9Q1KD42_9CARY|nr:hypothetical protein Cgig2_020358 [Carnegiea gigantea]